MELELNRTALPYHDLIFHTQVTREETMEMIVPDAYPDISKLLDTSGICCLNTREASEGTLSGVKVSVEATFRKTAGKSTAWGRNWNFSVVQTRRD